MTTDREFLSLPPRMTAPVHASRAVPRGGAAGPVLEVAMLAMGLIAGVFYAYDCSVMLGLAKTDDRTFVDVMQRLIVAIENPVFFASFVGALLLTAVAAVLERRLGPGGAFRWIIAALALYVVAIAVTIGVHMPLNQELVDAGDPDRIADLAAVRERFEARWVSWNIVRTVVSTAALACLGRALVLHGRDGLARAEADRAR